MFKALTCAAAISALVLVGCTRDDSKPASFKAPVQGDVGSSGGFADVVWDTSGGSSDAQTPSDGSVASPDGAPAVDIAKAQPKICDPGVQRCEGAQLATCTPHGDGWSIQACFPGQYCRNGACRLLENNLVIAFDTSGSMAATVKGKACTKQIFPNCKPAKDCTRMGVSKVTFGQALAGVDPKLTRLALFRFPQRLASSEASTCTKGHYAGLTKLSGDTDDQHVSADDSWYWNSLHQILCVGYPPTAAKALLQKKSIGRWMDGFEKIKSTGKACANPYKTCSTDSKCGGGACCAKSCHAHIEPELRANGSTPIGKTLFYIGEYFRNKIVVDGKACIIDADCNSPNYQCNKGYCVDYARACREHVVMLFTDGGQNNDPTYFFSPQVSAQRLRYGLACKKDNECTGGAKCTKGRCLPTSETGYHCMATSAPCKPNVSDKKHPHYCPALAGDKPRCLPDSLKLTSAKALKPLDNVLRSPDGQPFSVRVHVVDISGAPDISKSFYLAIAGGGRMLTADIADSTAFLTVLESAFDMKNKKVCGSKDGG